MHLFYIPNIKEKEFVLDEQESKHCVRVLRLKVGTQLHLSDGEGTLYKAEIVDANPKACKLELIETLTEYGKRSYYLHVAIAPTKNIDRFEWFLEKATEIGIDEITPILCDHSERKQIKHERLERVVVSAMKQSLKAYKPQLNNLMSYKDFMQQASSSIEQRYIAHCDGGEKSLIKNLYKPKESVLILIGPEGDFSPEEVEIALKNSYKPVSLGDSRLRTETAGVVAVANVSFLNS